MDSKVDWEIAFRIVFIGTIVQDYGSIWQTRSFCCAELIIYIILYIHVWYCCTDITYTYLYYSLIVISLCIHCISCICMVWYLVVLRCFWPLEWRRDTMRTLFGSPSCRGCSGFNPYIHSGCCKHLQAMTNCTVVIFPFLCTTLTTTDFSMLLAMNLILLRSIAANL